MNRNILGKAVRRAVELSERVGDRLKEFVSTEEVPYSYGLGGDERKPSFPSLYLSRSTDPSLMKMPGEGSAMVKYRIKRREIDESREDGQPLYGASIEIQSLDPVADETGLESSVFLKEFGVKPRSVQKLMKTSKRNPLSIGNGGFGDFVVQGKLRAPGGMGSYYTNDIVDARKTAADMLRRKRSALKDSALVNDWPKGKRFAALEQGHEFGSGGDKRLLRVAKSLKKKLQPEYNELFRSKLRLNPGNYQDAYHEAKKVMKPLDLNRKRQIHRADAAYLRISKKDFAEARDRDGEGRFASGNIPGAQDYAIAAMAAKQKKKPAGMVLPKGAAKPMGMR